MEGENAGDVPKTWTSPAIQTLFAGAVPKTGTLPAPRLPEGCLPNFRQGAGDGVDDEAADGDVLRHQGVADDGIDSLANGGLGVVEAFEPGGDTLGFPFRERVGGDAALEHMRLELVVAHMAGAAGGVMDHHHLLHPQLIDAHEQRTDGRIRLRQHQPAGVLDDLRIAVPEPQRLRQQLRQPRVHAREHRQLLGRKLVGHIGFVPLIRHELGVVGEDLVDHGCSVFTKVGFFGVSCNSRVGRKMSEYFVIFVRTSDRGVCPN